VLGGVEAEQAKGSASTVRQSATVLHGASESWRPETDDATRRRISCDRVLLASPPASPVSGARDLLLKDSRGVARSGDTLG
jgi:hypothetical protein